MSTSDFVGLIEPWECRDEDADSLGWLAEHTNNLRDKYEYARDVRERMMFSAWVQMLREEWDVWCEGYYNG